MGAQPEAPATEDNNNTNNDENTESDNTAEQIEVIQFKFFKINLCVKAESTDDSTVTKRKTNKKKSRKADD